MGTINAKLIFRSWMRNKVFSVISLLSLATGLACTTMLVVFVLHEYNIENDNSQKNRIWYMYQDSPMRSGDRISYIVGDIPPLLKAGYPEVEDYLRLQTAAESSVLIGNEESDPILILYADPSFPQFFPYEVISGNLTEALTELNKIALTERTARKLFGQDNPIGKTIRVEEHPLQVVAVLKDREQSFLAFDGLTANRDIEGVTLLLMNKEMDMQAFAQKLKDDKVPTMQMEKGQYYFSGFKDAYFNIYNTMEGHGFLKHQQRDLIYTGLFASLLVLFIACINYVNMSFSRQLQLIRSIQIQKLMGASRNQIVAQIFVDTLLIVFFAFLLSLLLMYLLLPTFNRIVSTDISFTFLFSGQVVPFICGFILLFSLVPAIYMSHRLPRLSDAGYKEQFMGQRKQTMITALTITQFSLSIALIMATLTVDRQIRFIQHEGSVYDHLIEIADWGSDNAYIPVFAEELKSRPELVSVTTAAMPFLNFGIRQSIVENEDGSETYHTIAQFYGESDYLETFRIPVLQGATPEKALADYAKPVYVNQQFIDLFVPVGENPIGKSISLYEDKSEASQATAIAGIISDFYVNSLEQEVYPCIVYIKHNIPNPQCVYIRLGDNDEQALATVRSIFAKHNPGKRFSYQNVAYEFEQRNKKAFDFSRLLLMFSLISITLTCFGLFGMTLYAAKQRTKEVAIRKVSGATIWQVMVLLNRKLVVWIGIACVIALPVAWYAMNRWLENFVYRVEVTPVSCLLAALIVFAITLLTATAHCYRVASENPVGALRSE